MKEILLPNGTSIKVTPQGYSSLEFTDRKIIPNQEQLIFESMLEQTRLRREADPSQNEATCKIETGMPWVGILGTGDWHIGNEYTDYELWHKHISMLNETEGLFSVIVGDERDNFVTPKFRAGLFEGVINPQQQADFVETWLKRLDSKGKVLARAGGNHDEWTWYQSGVSLENYWYREMKSPLFKNGGFLHLEVNGVKYEGYLHHGRSIFNSNFNPNHATKRAFEFQGPYDFAIMGHSHVAETAHSYRWTDSHHKDYVQVRSGTYKINDQYARGKQLGRGQEGGTCILFNSCEKRLFPILKIEDAVEILRALNNVDK